MARAAGDALQHPLLPLHRNGPAGSTEGSRGRSFHGGPDHRRTSREGEPVNPAREVTLRIRLMERSADARSHPMQPCATIALLVSVWRSSSRLTVVRLAQCAGRARWWSSRAINRETSDRHGGLRHGYACPDVSWIVSAQPAAVAVCTGAR